MRLGRLAVAGLVLIGGSAWAASGDLLVVTGDRVNVRSGPSTDAQVQTRLTRDQQVTEIERQGDWVRVEIERADGGEEGWIHGSLLAATEGTAEEPSPGVPEPAVGPAAADLPGMARFRESVTYLNSRAQQVAGVDLFTSVQPVGAGVVQVSITDDWATVPPAGQRSYLNTLVDRWAAAQASAGPVSVQIIDSAGTVIMEKSSGS